ncbi:ATP-binding protein [Chitinophaga sp. OAE865]|uniref:ATP-binding response regulator n=1 Tax=Chitinophaga sp. OAE865 TaxID=2817898 RepID=UPI001AE4EBAC
MQLLKRLSALTRTGTDGVPSEFEDQVIVVNTLSLMTALLAGTIGTGIAIELRDLSIFVAAWLEVLFFSGFILINYYHRHMTAAMAFLTVHNIGILYFGVWKGMVIEEEMLTVFLIITSLLILKSVWQISISIAISCTGLALAKINQRTNFITSEKVRDPGNLFHDWGMIALFILIITAIGFFKKYVVNLIEKLKKINESLDLLVRQRTVELEKANQNLNLFFRAIAHDINDELSAQLAMGGQIATEISASHQYSRLQQLVAVQNAASIRASSLVGNILDLRRIEAGEFDAPKNTTGDLKAWSYNLVEAMQFNANSKLIKIVLILEQEVPQFIDTDFLLLEKAVKNLLGNAIKFTRECGLVTLSISLCAGDLCLEVTDQGQGIKAEKQQKIFDLYVTEGQQGTGLGLHIVKRTIETLGGQIELESEQGMGSTFRLLIPFKFAEHITDTRMSAPQFSNSPVETKVSVLVIDDNDLARTSSRLILSSLDYEVLLATGGWEGLDIAKKQLPNLIILDSNLPDISGKEVLSRLRSDPQLRNIPVLVATGDRGKDIIKQFHPAPDDFLFKPFTNLEFVGSINRLVKLGALKNNIPTSS